jgi:predicted DNA-binding transcriptional regulator AlpA
MNDQPTHTRFVTIEYFWKDMLGMGDRAWFYRHKDDPGMPQRVYLGENSKPMLVYDECLAYMRARMEARGVPKKDPPKLKRRVGRPVSPPKLRA